MKIGATLKGKNLLPSGSKFFPLRVASILEAILGRKFQDFSLVYVKIIPFWLRKCIWSVMSTDFDRRYGILLADLTDFIMFAYEMKAPFLVFRLMYI